MAIISELSCSFPTLLHLSTKGEGFGASFPRGRTGLSAVKGCNFWAVGVAGQVWGLPQEPCLRVPWDSGDNVAARTVGSWCWGCREYRVSCEHSLFLSKGGTIQRQLSLGAGSLTRGQSPAPQPWQCFSGLFVYTSICHPLGKELAESL